MAWSISALATNGLWQVGRRHGPFGLYRGDAPVLMPEPRQSRSFQAGASIYEIAASGLAWRVERGSVRLDAGALSHCEISDRRVLEAVVNEPVSSVCCKLLEGLENLNTRTSFACYGRPQKRGKNAG